MDHFITAIDLGVYKTKLPFPAPLHCPPLLESRIKEISVEDLDQARELLVAWKAAKKARNIGLVDYLTDEARLFDKLRDDLEAEFGLKEHPRAMYLWKKVINKTSDLHEIVRLYFDYADIMI